MKKYLSRPENRLCADCKRPSPTWASLNIGVFVCIKCSGCHREIGVHITKIKSVELDLWPSKSLTDFSKINNEIANAYWEYDLKNYDFQRIRDNEIRLIEFIRDKYEHKRWAKPNVPDPMSLVIQGRDLVKEFMNNGEIVKLYEKSNEPELEKRSKHFNINKNEKKGKSFGIVDKKDISNKNNIINNISNTGNNNHEYNIENHQNKENNQKGFPFIKKKQNQKETNNNQPNTNKDNTGNIDLLGFGNDIITEQNNPNNDKNVNNKNETNNEINTIFPLDIFSFGQQNNNNEKSNNINITQEVSNNITEPNKPKKGFDFVKNRKKPQGQQTNNNLNNKPDINDLFGNNTNNEKNININTMSTLTTNITEQTPNITINNSKKTNKEDVINLFESEQLVDLFNIETPTSDAVLNLSKNLINIYSNEKEENNNINNKNIINSNQMPNSNYNFLNMNYPNININNYYPNNEQQHNKNAQIINNGYNMNPMMGYNYPNQRGFMNNNFGFWYPYNMNMNSNYMSMGIGMNNPINNGFNYNNEIYNDIKPEKEKEEQKPILLNNTTFDLNLSINLKKEKEDPFKNLVDFK